MADYTGLVKIADDFLSFDCGLKCKYNSGNLSKKDYDAELKKKRTELNNLLDDAQSERVIAYKVISGESTLEDLVNSNYKEVEAYVKSFKDFKTFQPDEKLDKKTRLLLRELYNSSEKGRINNNPMLTENIKRFGEKRSIFNPKMYDFWGGLDVLYGPLLVWSGIQFSLIGVFGTNSTNQSLFGIDSGTLLVGLSGCIILWGSSATYQEISSISKKTKFWRNPEKVLSVIKDESASQVVKAKKFDELYSAIKE